MLAFDVRDCKAKATFGNVQSWRNDIASCRKQFEGTLPKAGKVEWPDIPLICSSVLFADWRTGHAWVVVLTFWSHILTACDVFTPQLAMTLTCVS